MNRYRPMVHQKDGAGGDASAQLHLFPEHIAPTVRPAVDQGASIEERFEAFHRANPHVYEALKRLALQLRRNGRRRFGMKALFEYLRFSYALQTVGDDFKLNNNYTALYARKLMDEVPELRGFFELRGRRGEHDGGNKGS